MLRFIVLFLVAILASASATAETSKFKPIFDGKTLDGWIGDVDSYEVVDGVIRCKPGRGGNLLTEQAYGDFEVWLQFRVPPGGNNGLAVRAPHPDSDQAGDPAYVAMCELQVLDNSDPRYAKLDPRQFHGSAYGMVAAKRGHLREAGSWNLQRVVVKGSTIRVELNGETILDCDLATVTEYLADKPHPGKDRTTGHFGFAGHGDAVEYREIEIREL